MMSILLMHVLFVATLLLSVAILISWLTVRYSADWRHQIWTRTLLGLLLVPICIFALPSWSFFQSVPHQEQVYFEDQYIKYPYVETVLNRVDVPTPIQEHAESIATVDQTVQLPVLYEFTSLEQGIATTKTEMPTPTSDLLPKLNVTFLLSALVPVWGIISFLFLIRLFGSLISAQRLRRTFRPIDDPELRELLQQIAKRQKINKPVQLMLTEKGIPFTVGITQPQIVLPQHYQDWSKSEIRSVLTHELAHIVRKDLFWQVLARFTLSLYWFHPLCWFAVHRLRIERESACDDVVLSNGEEPAVYANTLLHVVTGLKQQRIKISGCVVAMSQRKEVKRRITTILNPNIARTPLGLTGRWVFTIVALCGILAIGTFSPFIPITKSLTITEDMPTQTDTLETPSTPVGPLSANPAELSVEKKNALLQELSQAEERLAYAKANSQNPMNKRDMVWLFHLEASVLDAKIELFRQTGVLRNAIQAGEEKVQLLRKSIYLFGQLVDKSDVKKWGIDLKIAEIILESLHRGERELGQDAKNKSGKLWLEYYQEQVKWAEEILESRQKQFDAGVADMDDLATVGINLASVKENLARFLRDEGQLIAALREQLDWSEKAFQFTKAAYELGAKKGKTLDYAQAGVQLERARIALYRQLGDKAKESQSHFQLVDWVQKKVDATKTSAEVGLTTKEDVESAKQELEYWKNELEKQEELNVSPSIPVDTQIEEQQRAILESQQELAEMCFQKFQRGYDLGTISQSELCRAGISVANAKIKLATWQKDKERLLTALKEKVDWCHRSFDYAKSAYDMGRKDVTAFTLADAGITLANSQIELYSESGQDDLLQQTLREKCDWCQKRVDFQQSALDVGGVPQTNLLQAELELKQAQLELKQAELKLQQPEKRGTPMSQSVEQTGQ
ncbi:MAG: M56 family metallopeptidase [Thermoguttaceae bacterium]